MTDSMNDQQTEPERANEEPAKDKKNPDGLQVRHAESDNGADSGFQKGNLKSDNFVGSWDALAKLATEGCQKNLLNDAADRVTQSVYFKAFGEPKQAAETLLSVRPSGEHSSIMLSLVALLVASLSLINDVLVDQTSAGRGITVAGTVVLIAAIAVYLLYSNMKSSRNAALVTVLTYIKCHSDENTDCDDLAKKVKLPNIKCVCNFGMAVIALVSLVVIVCSFVFMPSDDSGSQQPDLNSAYASLSTQGIGTRAQLDAASKMLKEKKNQTADSAEQSKLDTRIQEVDQASQDISKALGADHSSPNLASALGGLAQSILDGKIKLADSLIDLGGVTLSPALSLTPTLSVDLGDQVKEYLSNISTELTNISNNTASLSASFDSTEINKILEELTEIENKYNIDLSSVKNSIAQIRNSSSSTTIINNSFNGSRDACACNAQNDSGCGCG